MGENVLAVAWPRLEPGVDPVPCDLCEGPRSDWCAELRGGLTHSGQVGDGALPPGEPRVEVLGVGADPGRKTALGGRELAALVEDLDGRGVDDLASGGGDGDNVLGIMLEHAESGSEGEVPNDTEEQGVRSCESSRGGAVHVLERERVEPVEELNLKKKMSVSNFV